MAGPGKVFKMEVLRWMENVVLNLDFANSRAMIRIF